MFVDHVRILVALRGGDSARAAELAGQVRSRSPGTSPHLRARVQLLEGTAFLESGAVWALAHVHRLDEHLETFGFPRGNLTLRPSEYFQRQCFVSCEEMEPGLNAMLEAIGLARSAVYITNILKCRPPKNRDPAGDEIQACADYLSRQIELIGPRVILASGRIATQSLLGSTQPIGRMRGKLHHHEPSGLPLIATYHPAYLLRSPTEKAKVWQDLKMLRSFLDEQSHGEPPRRPA